MTTERLQTISDAILDAHQSSVPIEHPAERFGALSFDDAYAILEQVAANRGTVAAWKVGAASADAEPIKAPIMKDDVFASGTAVKAVGERLVGIELEIAFRMSKDLPAREQPYRRAEIEAAIDAVLPAIELCDSRLAPIDDLDAMWKLADAQVNLGLVLGNARTDGLDMDASVAEVKLCFDDDVVQEGVSHNNAGDPLRLIEWMVNNRPDHCGGLKRGQIVTTGSLSGIRFVPAGTHVKGEIAGLGSVAVTISS